MSPEPSVPFDAHDPDKVVYNPPRYSEKKKNFSQEKHKQFVFDDWAAI